MSYRNCLMRWTTNACALRMKRRLLPKVTSFCTMTQNGDKDVIEFESSFDETQKETILKTLNEGDLDVLRGHDLARNRAQNVLRYRQKNGKFLQLRDVLEVDGFGMKFLSDFCKNVVGETNATTKTNRSVNKKRFFEPSLSENMKNSIESVVSLKFHSKGAVWSHLDANRNIIDMKVIQTPTRHRVYDHIFNLRVARDILSNLPKTDAYLLEQHKLQQKSLSAMTALRIIVQMESVFFTLLDSDNQDRIFSAKSDAVWKFCSERFDSSISDASLLLDKLVNSERYLSINSESWKRFSEQDKTIKNYLAKSVLLSVAFYETEVKLTD